MRLAKLKIRGFRGANSAARQLTPHSVLIGSSNSGETRRCWKDSSLKYGNRILAVLKSIFSVRCNLDECVGAPGT